MEDTEKIVNIYVQNTVWDKGSVIRLVEAVCGDVQMVGLAKHVTQSVVLVHSEVNVFGTVQRTVYHGLVIM